VQDNTIPIWELQVAYEETALCQGLIVGLYLMMICGRRRSWQVAIEV
jgi:hypothetical protein